MMPGRWLGDNGKRTRMPVFPVFSRRALAVAAAIGCLACGASAPPTRYYALDLPRPTPAAERLAHTAVLMPIRAGEIARQGRIVYRESPHEVGFYEYHRWAEDPEDSVAEALAGALLARGTFASVTPFDGRTQADFILRGELRRIEEIDHDAPVRASVEIALELVDADTSRVVWSDRACAEQVVPTAEVRAVVETMSASADRAIKRLAGLLDSHLRAGGQSASRSSSGEGDSIC